MGRDAESGMMADQKCGNCAYGQERSADRGGKATSRELQCFLNPPVVTQVTLDTVPKWKRPPVESEDYCSSWSDPK